MAFPNVSDIIATTIEQRSGEIADNVSNNNALFKRLSEKGRVKSFSGGRLIYEELAFAANPNGSWYSGYDVLPVGAADVISAAEFAIKQLAVPVVISGLEMLQNSGKEQIIDLIEARVGVAESTMANLLGTGAYSDGTGFGGKQLTGLDLAVPAVPTTGTYGGINRATAGNTFWQSQILTITLTAANIQTQMNTLWAKCVRGMDRPDLIMAGSTAWALYLASLQALQRFVDVKTAALGFPAVKYMDADLVLDGGIGGAATATNLYFLNTKYLYLRPHKDRTMKALDPSKRSPINQDSQVQILAWAGNMTCSGAQFQGRLTGA
jgi:hypothetical protein